jgi:hypothetical protein
MRLNACELEIDLFCRGLRVPSAAVPDEARGVRRTRAGLGSGLELVLSTGSRLKRELWMNVPIDEPFARRSPYVLIRFGDARGSWTSATAAAMTRGCRGSRRGTTGTRPAAR